MADNRQIENMNYARRIANELGDHLLTGTPSELCGPIANKGRYYVQDEARLTEVIAQVIALGGERLRLKYADIAANIRLTYAPGVFAAFNRDDLQAMARRYLDNWILPDTWIGGVTSALVEERDMVRYEAQQEAATLEPQQVWVLQATKGLDLYVGAFATESAAERAELKLRRAAASSATVETYTITQLTIQGDTSDA